MSYKNNNSLAQIVLKYCETLNQKDKAHFETSLIRYCLPGFGFSASSGGHRTSKETLRAYSFISNLEVSNLGLLQQHQEWLFNDLGTTLSGNVRRLNRSVLKKFVTWCRSEGIWRVHVDKDIETYCPRRKTQTLGKSSRTTDGTAKEHHMIKPEDISFSLSTELETYKDYWTSPFLVDRQDNKVAKTTVEYNLLFIKRLLGWMVYKKGFSADSLSINSVFPSRETEEEYKKSAKKDCKYTVSLIVEYVSWLCSEANKSRAYIHNVFNAQLSLAKFCYRHITNYPEIKKYRDIIIIEELRSKMLEIEKQGNIGARRRIDCYQELPTLPELIQCAKNLRERCGDKYASGNQNERSLTAIARSFQRYFQVALLVYLPPRRQGVIRNLEIGKTLRKLKGKWAICLWEEDSYKTFKIYRDVTITIPDILQEDLDLYIDKYRQAFYPSPENNYFFLTYEGTNIKSGDFNSIFKRAVYAEIGKICSPHEVRSITVGHLKDSGASDAVMESLAHSMGHSREMQHRVYDKRSQEQKSLLAQQEMLKVAGIPLE